jgi:hypothetical protein
MRTCRTKWRCSKLHSRRIASAPKPRTPFQSGREAAGHRADSSWTTHPKPSPSPSFNPNPTPEYLTLTLTLVGLLSPALAPAPSSQLGPSPPHHTPLHHRKSFSDDVVGAQADEGHCTRLRVARETKRGVKRKDPCGLTLALMPRSSPHSDLRPHTCRQNFR